MELTKPVWRPVHSSIPFILISSDVFQNRSENRRRMGSYDWGLHPRISFHACTTERRKIAQGKVAGKTARQIAAEVGLSESSVEKASKDPRTSLLIQRLKERDEEILGRCWKKAVASIESHLDSDDQDLVKDARKDLLRYVTAGDPPQIKMEAPTKAASGDFTLAELLSTLRRIQEGDSPA